MRRSSVIGGSSSSSRTEASSSTSFVAMDALFQVQIHGLEDFSLLGGNHGSSNSSSSSSSSSGNMSTKDGAIVGGSNAGDGSSSNYGSGSGLLASASLRKTSRRNTNATSIADSLFDLLQHEYTVSWKTGKQKGSTERRLIKSKYADEFSREDYNFIDQHSQIVSAAMKQRQQPHAKEGKRTFGNITHLLPTSHRDSPPTTPTTHEPPSEIAEQSVGSPSSPTMTPQSIRERRKKQNRMSLTTRQNSLVRKSKRLVYAVDFEYEMDMLLSMKLDSSDKKYAMMPPRIKEKVMTFEIKEWRGNDSSTVATITANLVDFTTPLNVMGQLKRSALFPVKLRNNKLCKLRVTISSIWLNTHQFQSHLHHMLQSVGEKQRKKYSEYFVVEEDEEQFYPATNPNMQLSHPAATISPAVSHSGIFTPRAAHRKGDSIDVSDASFMSAITQPMSNASSSSTPADTTVMGSSSKPITIPTLAIHSASHHGSVDNTLSDPSSSSSPRSGMALGVSPRTNFTQDASHFVTQLKKLKTDMFKLQQEKKELQTKLQEHKFGTTVDEHDTPIASRLKSVINRLFSNCGELKDQISTVEQTVSQIHGRVDLFERERSGMPRFQVSPGEGPQTIGLVYLDIHGKSRMWNLSQEVMMSVLDIYEDLLADSLHQCSGSVLQTDGDSVVCCFASCKMAIRFCLLLQIKLHSATWPQDLLDLDDHSGDYDVLSASTSTSKSSLLQRLHRSAFEELDAELDSLPSVPRVIYRPVVRGLGVRMGIEVARMLELSDSSQIPTIPSASNYVPTSSGRALLRPDGLSSRLHDTTREVKDSSMPTLRYFFHDASKQFVFFGLALKRAITISQYAQAGQIFISDHVWLALQEENKILKLDGDEDRFPPIRTIVQDLGMHHLHGLAMEDADNSLDVIDNGSDDEGDQQVCSRSSSSCIDMERLRLVIPEQLQGREYSQQQIDDLELCTSQSFLVNSLYDCLDQWREDVMERIKEQLNGFEEELLKVNMLCRMVESEHQEHHQTTKDESNSMGSLPGLAEKQQELTSQMLAVRNKCDWIENKITQFEGVLRGLSTQILLGGKPQLEGNGQAVDMSTKSVSMVEGQIKAVRNLILDSSPESEMERIKTEFEKKLRERDSEIERLSQERAKMEENSSRTLDTTITKTLSLLDNFSFDDSSDEEMEDDEGDSVILEVNGIATMDDTFFKDESAIDMDVGDDAMDPLTTPTRDKLHTPSSKKSIGSKTSTPLMLSPALRTSHSPALERLKNQNDSIRQKIDMYRQQKVLQ